MTVYRHSATFAALMAAFILACEKSAAPAAGEAVPSRSDVSQAIASGGADETAPFDIAVTGAKTARASGGDATYCARGGDPKIFTLSLVAPTWAVSIGGMGERPGVGTHPLVGDMSKGLAAQLIDKTPGSDPTAWLYHATTGTLMITRSDTSGLASTYDVAATAGGPQLRAQGKFEANPSRC